MFDYICTICGAEFKRAENDYHDYHNCCYCGNELERVEHCEICGAPVADSKFKYHLCNNCEEKTKVLFCRFLADLDTTYQIELLQEETDGIDWNLWRVRGVSR